MWSHVSAFHSELPAEQLWAVLADVARWPEIDANIGRLEINDHPGPGAQFMLQPRGGPRLRFTINEFHPPRRYSDVCSLPGGRMTTVHELMPEASGGTRIVVQIIVDGPFAWLWARVVGRRHAAGLPAQTARFIAAARERSLSA